MDFFVCMHRLRGLQTRIFRHLTRLPLLKKRSARRRKRIGKDAEKKRKNILTFAPNGGTIRNCV